MHAPRAAAHMVQHPPVRGCVREWVCASVGNLVIRSRSRLCPRGYWEAALRPPEAADDDAVRSTRFSGERVNGLFDALSVGQTCSGCCVVSERVDVEAPIRTTRACATYRQAPGGLTDRPCQRSCGEVGCCCRLRRRTRHLEPVSSGWNVAARSRTDSQGLHPSRVLEQEQQQRKSQRARLTSLVATVPRNVDHLERAIGVARQRTPTGHKFPRDRHCGSVSVRATALAHHQVPVGSAAIPSSPE